MTISDNNSPDQPLTSLQEGSIWRLLRVTLIDDAFILPYTNANVVFGGDLEGLSINGYVPPGTSGLGMNQVILDGVHGTITRTTGEGTITIKGAALQGGDDLTLTIDITSP